MWCNKYIGNKSGSEDSSFNNPYLCASFFVGDFMKNDDYFMRLALEEAKKAYELGEVPVGAVIILNNSVVGKGYNCKESESNCLAHAEIMAINEACGNLKSWRLNDCVLYITMEPCSMCFGAIAESRISRIVYALSSDSKQMFSFREDKLNNDELVNECLNLMREFFKNLRNKE